MVSQAVDVDGVRYLGVATPGVGGGDLRTLALDLRERLGSGPAVVALVGGADKPTAIVATNDAARGLGLGAGMTGVACGARGKGGGKPDLAQGGGTDASAAPQALAAVRARDAWLTPSASGSTGARRASAWPRPTRARRSPTPWVPSRPVPTSQRGLAAIVAEYEPGAIYVGLPLTLNYSAARSPRSTSWRGGGAGRGGRGRWACGWSTSG